MKLQTLLDALSDSMSPAECEMIERAYAVADKAHEGQQRASGEPYVQHCLQTAHILATLRMPAPVIAAGLLHDTVEDTSVTLDDLRRDFGPEVAALVDGVTKLAQLPRVSKEGNQPIDRNTESLRKTFLAMNDDVRVVLIKLADRLHNMRTLSYVKPEKQYRIARETLEIFAPLANRLGIWQIKWELEDLSLRYVDPVKFKKIAKQIADRCSVREEEIAEIIEHLTRVLGQAGIKVEITGRPKHIYSIYKKMKKKGKTFEMVRDIR